MELTPEDKRLEQERRTQLFKDFTASEDYMQKLVTRLQINDACNNRAEAREIVYKQCERLDNTAEGCIFFIENFGFTYDPRPDRKPGHLPFILFDFQKDAIRWLVDKIENGNDGLVEKSRDMGATWIMFVWVPLYFWLFRDGINLLMGSYKEDLVDNRTDDSIFGRLEYSINSLPRWIQPRGFQKSKHRSHRRIINPANHNLLAGDTMNPDFGRGSRKTAVLFDELGSWDYAKDAWETCGDTTPCRIANSTPKGYNFYAMLRETGIDVLTLHWRDHPLKDEQWYKFETSRRSPEEVAQELDISYAKSQEGRVYSEWNEGNIEYGLFPYDPEKPMYVGWDFGRSDDTAIIWTQKVDGELRIIDAYRNTNKLIDFYVPFVNGIVSSDKYNYSYEDMQVIERHRKWKTGTHFGDPSGRFHNNVVEDTVFSVLKDNGIHMNFRDEWKEWNRRKNSAKRRILDGIQFNKTKGTEWLNVCMLNANYPRNRSGGTEEIRSEKPKHDYTSHYRSAFEYLCLGLELNQETSSKVYDRFPKKDRSSTDRRGRRIVGY